ncbi:MAG: hypothetical protein ABR537_06905 [Gemmatimonadales bacterium]
MSELGDAMSGHWDAAREHWDWVSEHWDPVSEHWDAVSESLGTVTEDFHPMRRLRRRGALDFGWMRELRWLLPVR